jgi:hypothetical protein
LTARQLRGRIATRVTGEKKLIKLTDFSHISDTAKLCKNRRIFLW